MNDIVLYNSTDIIEILNDGEQKTIEETKYLKEIEVIKLLSNIKNELHSLLFLFLFETGARCTEALLVKMKDIDPYNKTVKLITLKRHKDKNGNRKPPVYRVLTISDALLSRILLYERRLNLSLKDDIFTRKAGNGHISIQAVNQAMGKYVVSILGEEYKSYGHPHVLRHSRAIQLLNSGEVDLTKLMKILGHSHIRNTMIYSQFSNKDIQDAVRRANAKIGLY